MAAQTPPTPPSKKPPRDPHSVGSMLGTIAIAIGFGVVGAYMLDIHSHTCEACGHKWRHFGVFNLGDPSAHACKNCGTVQWYKDGIPHVFRTALREPPPKALPGSSLAGLFGKSPSAPAPLSIIPSARGVLR